MRKAFLLVLVAWLLLACGGVIAPQTNPAGDSSAEPGGDLVGGESIPGADAAPGDADGDGLAGDLGPEPSCDDHQQNGNETGVDCGGSCPPCSQGPYASHPIAIDQTYIVPEDCEDDDVVGMFNTLYTDPIFHHRQGSYSFAIVAGNTDDAFAIDAQTGALTVNSAAAIESGVDFDLQVRVAVDADESTALAHVHVLNDDDTVYLDCSYTGTTSNGRRATPYKSFKDDDLAPGQAGKAYLFRRGTTAHDEQIYLENAENSAKIIIGAWGKGERPIFDGGSQNTTFLRLGSWYSAGEPETDKCHHVDVFDLDMRNYGVDVGGRMIVVPRAGHTFNFYRLRAAGGVSGNGAIYFMAASPVATYYDSDIYAQDIESYNNAGRGVKIEAGGVLVENFKDIGSENTPISACMTPHVTLRYIYAEGNGGTGPNLRQFDQNVEWAYFTGYYRAIFIHPTLDVPGYGPWPLNDNHIRNVIIDGTTGSSGITMEPAAGATNVPENLVIDRILVRGALSSGVDVGAGAIHTTVSYSLFHHNGKGVTIDAGTAGTVLHNVIAVDNSSIDIENSQAGSGDLVNTIFESLSGTFAVASTNHSLTEGAYFVDRALGDYRPSSSAPYVGGGTSLGYAEDLDGMTVKDPPTIGCYEYQE